MNKSEFAKHLSDINGNSVEDNVYMLDLVFKELTSCLIHHKKVQIMGFGTFELRKSSRTSCYDFQINRPVKVEARNRLTLRPSDRLKKRINAPP